MITLHPQFINDPSGQKSLVILTAKEFDAIMEELEELEDIQLYDKVILANEPSIPIHEAFAKIDANRKK